MTPSLLITQCLQDDFVKPVGRYEPLPNLLHVGYEEARRLMGDDPAEGPVARMMRWAYAMPDERLRIVHVRDWHDAGDPGQGSHLRQFGEHCLRGSPGARFAFEEPPVRGKDVAVVDSLTLNDFQGTRLAEVLSAYAGRAARVGLVGVWTEAKISFLAYELRTRYPGFEVAVCSALTASSSRAQHFMALDQLQRLLGVRVLPSMGEFIRFLGGEGQEAPLAVPAGEFPALELESGARVSDADRRLLRYLFRDAKSASFRCLDGGFSGNVVLGSESVDAYGHAQVPHVVKIGPLALIGQERAAFERVQSVLGNNAPHLADFADLGDRGAIKYRYAAMGGGSSTTFQKLYCQGLSDDKIRRCLDAVFLQQLGRFYQAATQEQCNLLEYYAFAPAVAPRVRSRVEALLGAPADGATLLLPGGAQCANPCRFYETDLPELLPLAARSSYLSYIHGDLNGANIIVDGHENVWLIDFFHTHRGHVLKDLLKLENDVLYIFTPIDAASFSEALKLSDWLASVEDLGRPLAAPESFGIRRPELLRAGRTVALLRSYYPELVRLDREPLQAFIGQLRYAAHTLSFDESDVWQKRWALYTMGLASAKITGRLRRAGPLRVDWLEPGWTAPGRLGITLLPGRRDHGRSVKEDVAALKEAGVTHVACLLSVPEFHRFGVDDLLRAYRDAGLQVRHLPVADQSVCTLGEMRGLVAWLESALAGKGTAVVHCAGGLGRSGMAAACLLRSRGASAAEAVAEVRRARSPRAIETAAQEEFVRWFT